LPHNRIIGNIVIFQFLTSFPSLVSVPEPQINNKK
jgi:hypothetical protein